MHKSSVENHVRLKHTLDRPFPCTVCPSRFTLRKDLERHMRIHTGEKPFECPHCHCKFNQKSTLKTHLNKKFSCQGDVTRPYQGGRGSAWHQVV
ncbi:UNVERIFIED_CONTAM: hypothetical protein GTU68_059856 [Idotea baltica]|nr:hypothetical protein [Idotea baltica]